MLQYFHEKQSFFKAHWTYFILLLHAREIAAFLITRGFNSLPLLPHSKSFLWEFPTKRLLCNAIIKFSLEGHLHIYIVMNAKTSNTNNKI